MFENILRTLYLYQSSNYDFNQFTDSMLNKQILELTHDCNVVSSKTFTYLIELRKMKLNLSMD